MAGNIANKSQSELYVLEVPSVGEIRIRTISTVERASMVEFDLEEFDWWKHDGSPRFWAYSYTAEQLKAHGFSMKDAFSKRHGFHESDFVALGDGVFEDYEDGFENADAIAREFGHFVCFMPEYSWGCDDRQVLPPTFDFSGLLPPCFLRLIAERRLVVLVVTSSVKTFLDNYAGHIEGFGGESLKALAYRLGLLSKAG